MTNSKNRQALWGLPDPDLQGEFYADIPVKRGVAWILDTVFIVAVTLLVVLLTVGIGFFFFGFILLVVGFIYRSVTIANKSSTWGMRLVAIELRNHRGERLDTGTALLHTLGYTLSMSFVFPQLLSIILMMTGARAQGLTDMILGTAAINRDARA
ncbi:MAG TPA: RDD family protein [Aliiroseovarius sp.]|nr:RDD family protein [Aliiroseovarius sp.]